MHMKTKNKNLTSLDEYVEDKYGKLGSSKREKFERGFEVFKIGFLLEEARNSRGMTQEELAAKCGTNKSYISRIEVSGPSSGCVRQICAGSPPVCM